MASLRIIYVHDGLAFYPSMLAGKNFFSSLGYKVEEKRSIEIDQNEDFSESVLWLMMGFYPKPISVNALAVIHEYRSQSLGSYRSLRDLAKRWFNHTPSYRLFQSDRIRKIFERNDGVPGGLLPLGVSSNILKFRVQEKIKAKYDFCYIGAISNERLSKSMLDGFLEAYGDSRSFVLVGDVYDNIEQYYKMHENIHFTGRVSQEQAYNYVNSSEYSVCFFPKHPPHCFQPPTKLYEYAALGKRIIANDAPSSLNEIHRLGIAARIIRENAFPSEEALRDIPGNGDFDPSSLFFENLFYGSGIVDFLNKKFGSLRR